MLPPRPDLTSASPEVLAYSEALEAEVAYLREQLSQTGAVSPPEATESQRAEALEPAEPPTTINLITLSRAGEVKRTPRHLYTRQRRGGMGIFDIELGEADAPAALLAVDEAQSVVVLTERARAFRLLVSALPATPVHGRGRAVAEFLPLDRGDRPMVYLPAHERGYLAVLTNKAWIRILPAHLLGEKMQPGFPLFLAEEYGAPVAACWTPGDSDLFIATRQGLAIRFAEKQIPLTGALGMRVESGDEAFALLSVKNDTSVLLLGADGKGTIRLMSGFSANKAPGSGGKTALKTDKLAAAFVVNETDDLFIISQLSKIIRFKAAEIPAKDGVVQGVNCMSLRADEVAVGCSSN